MEIENALEETIPTEQPVQSDEVSQADELQTQQTVQEGKFTIPIKYNKQEIELLPEQAAELAQKGMKFDDMRSVMDKLAYLSATMGKSADSIIDSIIESNEQDLANRLREAAGDDEELFSKLLELEHSKHQKAYDRVINSYILEKENSVAEDNLKLANEFAELKNMFPQIETVSQIPNEVLKNAQQNSLSLLDSYLRYRYTEDKKIEQAKQKDAIINESLVGSQQSAVSDAQSVQDAIINGIWSKN